MKPITDQSPIALGLVVAAVGIAIGAGVSWGSFATRVDGHDRDIARIESRQVTYVETVQGIKNDMDWVKKELVRLHVSMKKREDKEVAARAGAPKTQCSLFNPGPFSMTGR